MLPRHFFRSLRDIVYYVSLACHVGAMFSDYWVTFPGGHAGLIEECGTWMIKENNGTHSLNKTDIDTRVSCTSADCMEMKPPSPYSTTSTTDSSSTTTTAPKKDWLDIFVMNLDDKLKTNNKPYNGTTEYDCRWYPFLPEPRYIHASILLWVIALVGLLAPLHKKGAVRGSNTDSSGRTEYALWALYVAAVVFCGWALSVYSEQYSKEENYGPHASLSSSYRAGYAAFVLAMLTIALTLLPSVLGVAMGKEKVTEIDQGIMAWIRNLLGLRGTTRNTQQDESQVRFRQNSREEGETHEQMASDDNTLRLIVHPNQLSGSSDSIHFLQDTVSGEALESNQPSLYDSASANRLPPPAYDQVVSESHPGSVPYASSEMSELSPNRTPLSDLTSRAPPPAYDQIIRGADDRTTRYNPQQTQTLRLNEDRTDRDPVSRSSSPSSRDDNEMSAGYATSADPLSRMPRVFEPQSLPSAPPMTPADCTSSLSFRALGDRGDILVQGTELNPGHQNSSGPTSELGTYPERAVSASEHTSPPIDLGLTTDSTDLTSSRVVTTSYPPPPSYDEYVRSVTPISRNDMTPHKETQ